MEVEYGLITYGPPQPGTSASAAFNSGAGSGSADVTFRADIPGLLGLNMLFRLTADVSAVLADHPVVDPTDSTFGWFTRNEWHRVTYYAVAPRSTFDGFSSSPFGCELGDCLRFNDAGTYNIRALLVLAGRSLSNPGGRPNATLADYLEYQNCDLSSGVCDPQTLFEQRLIRTSKVSVPSLNAPFNDRVVLLDWVAPNPTFPLIYKLP